MYKISFQYFSLVVSTFLIVFNFILQVLPGGWCLENIAKLLKLCGDAICCEFLGSKAINGRTQELAFIAYYIFQVKFMCT
jgi:hypothetical protein